MEIKATLNKPYTDNERLNFIVTQNHQKGYEIRETEQALEAWGKTVEEEQEAAKQTQRAELISRLDDLDLKTIRSLRAIQAGVGTEDDSSKLAELEEQAEAIRQQLNELNSELNNEL